MSGGYEASIGASRHRKGSLHIPSKHQRGAASDITAAEPLRLTLQGRHFRRRGNMSRTSLYTRLPASTGRSSDSDCTAGGSFNALRVSCALTRPSPHLDSHNARIPHFAEITTARLPLMNSSYKRAPPLVSGANEQSQMVRSNPHSSPPNDRSQA